MNKLALSAIMIGGLLQTAGCIITTSDNDEAASFDVAWNTAECPAGTSAEVISLPSGAARADAYVDIFDCDAGGGVTALLPLGNYEVWIEVTSADGSQLLAQSNFVSTSLGFDLEIVNVDILDFPFGAGFFEFDWNLIDTGGNTLTCADVFADGLSVLSTQAGTGTAIDDVFDCAAGTGVTGELEIGTYTVAIDLLDESDQSLLDAAVVRDDEVITRGNELVKLDPDVDFLFAE